MRNRWRKARQKIIEMPTRAKGFNDIDVQYRIDTDEARGTSRVVYTINEGTKGAVSAIRFEGNHAFSARTLRKQMKTKGKTMISLIDKSGRLDEAQLQQDLDQSARMVSEPRLHRRRDRGSATRTESWAIQLVIPDRGRHESTRRPKSSSRETK